jgi:hypothetical protein
MVREDQSNLKTKLNLEIFQNITLKNSKKLCKEKKHEERDK